VGTAIAESFAAIEARLPRGEVAPRGEALALHERSGAELRAAAGREVAVHTGADGAWTVIVEDDDTPRPMPLHRFLRIHPANEMYNLQSLLEPYVDHLAGVAIAGFDEGATLHAPLSALGASRICRPGSLQTPPLDWPRDGHAAFTSLARTNPA
jgi:hypothetical protein